MATKNRRVKGNEEVQVNTWETNFSEDFQHPTSPQLWRTSLSENSEGLKMVGLRKIALKATGEQQMTKSGFNFVQTSDSPKLLRKLAGMLTRLADQIEQDTEE